VGVDKKPATTTRVTITVMMLLTAWAQLASRPNLVELSALSPQCPVTVMPDFFALGSSDFEPEPP
jgi:NADPH-dependent 7-cyano-7-deazaguanine reductase QueF